MNNLDRIKQRLEESLEKHKKRLLKTRESKNASTIIRKLKDKTKEQNNIINEKLINTNEILNNKQCNFRKKTLENFKNYKLLSNNKKGKKYPSSYKSCEIKKKDIKTTYSKDEDCKNRINSKTNEEKNKNFQGVKKKEKCEKEGNYIAKINSFENKKNLKNFVKKIEGEDNSINIKMSDNNNDFHNISKGESDYINDLFRNFVNCKINNLYVISGERNNYPKYDFNSNEKELEDIECGDNAYDEEKEGKEEIIKEIKNKENIRGVNKNDLKNVKMYYDDKGTHENNLKKLMEIERNMKKKIKLFEEEKKKSANEDETLCSFFSSKSAKLRKFSTESNDQLTFTNSYKNSMLINLSSSSMSLIASNEEKKSISDSVELFTTQKNIYSCNYLKKKNANKNILKKNYIDGYSSIDENYDNIYERNLPVEKSLISKYIYPENNKRKKGKKFVNYLLDENSYINYKRDISKNKELLKDSRRYVETTENEDKEEEENYNKKLYNKQYDKMKKSVSAFSRNMSIQEYDEDKKNKCKNTFYNLVNEDILINDKDTFNDENINHHLNMKKKKKNKIMICDKNNMNEKSYFGSFLVKDNFTFDSNYYVDHKFVGIADNNNNMKEYKKKLLKNKIRKPHYQINPLTHKIINSIDRKNKGNKNVDKKDFLKKAKYELTSLITSSNTYISNYSLYNDCKSSNDKKNNILNNVNYDKTKKYINKNFQKYRNNYYYNNSDHDIDHLRDYDHKHNFIKEQIEKWKKKKIPSYLKKNSHYFKNILSNIYNDKNNLTLEFSNDLLKNAQKHFLSNEYIFENNLNSLSLEKKKNISHINNLNSKTNNLNIKNLSLMNSKENNCDSNFSILSRDGKDKYDITENCFICSFPIHKNEKKYFLKKELSDILQYNKIKKKFKERDQVKHKDTNDVNENCNNKNHEDSYDDIEIKEKKNEQEKWFSESEKEKYFIISQYKRNKEDINDENIKLKWENYGIKKEKIEKKISEIKLNNNKKIEIMKNESFLTSEFSSNNFRNNLNPFNYINNINKNEKYYNEINRRKKYIKKNKFKNRNKRAVNYLINKNYLELIKNYDMQQNKKEKYNEDNEIKLITDQINDDIKKKKVINYIKNIYLLQSIDPTVSLEGDMNNQTHEHSFKNPNNTDHNDLKNNNDDKKKYENENVYDKKLRNTTNIGIRENAKISYLNNNDNIESIILKEKTENDINSTNNNNNNVSLLKDNKEKDHPVEKKNDYFNEHKKEMNEKKNKINIKINSNVLKKILKMKIESMKNDINNKQNNEERKMELNSFNGKNILELPNETLTYYKKIESEDYKENTKCPLSNDIECSKKYFEIPSKNSHEINFDNNSNNFNEIISNNRISSIENFFDSNNNAVNYDKSFRNSSENLLVNKIEHNDNINNIKHNNNSVNVKCNNRNDNIDENDYAIDIVEENKDNKNCNYNNNNDNTTATSNNNNNSSTTNTSNINENIRNYTNRNNMLYKSNINIEVLDFDDSYYCYLKKMQNSDVYPNSEEPITKDDKIKLMKAYLNKMKKKNNPEKYLLKYNIEFFKLAQFFCEDSNLYNNYLKDLYYNLSKNGDDLDKTAFSILKLIGSNNRFNEKTPRDNNKNIDLPINTEMKNKNYLKIYNRNNTINEEINYDSINKFSNKKNFSQNFNFLRNKEMDKNLYKKKNNSLTLSETVNQNKITKSKFDQNSHKMNCFIYDKNKLKNESLIYNKANFPLDKKPLNSNYREKNKAFFRSNSSKSMNENKSFDKTKKCYITRRSSSTIKKKSLLKTSALIEKYEKLKCI